MAPTVRSFSADIEPLRLVGRHPQHYPGYLESVAVASGAPAPARYDILPISNGEFLEQGGDGRLRGAAAAHAGGFLDALDQWWRALRVPATAGPGLPFLGGWLVYLGYEVAGEVEPTLWLPRSDEPFTALAIRAPAAWVRDRAAGKAWVVCEAGHESLVERFAAHALDGAPEPVAAPPAPIEIHEEPAPRFVRAVGRALAYIAAGDIYQANLSRQWSGTAVAPLDPVALYRRLRASNPGPFAGLLRHGAFSVLSSSPERLLSIRDGRIATRPIAGTRPRGASAAEDAALTRNLLQNEKERAEHVMLIDLERNDLGRVCTGGSVEVDEYMTIETYAHVHHIVSNVRGRLRPDVTPIGAVRALFPGGTITGCPKVRCMQIIAELEGRGRGAYTGSLGYLNRDGSADFNILIRTITADGQAVRFRAGAGIVADSDPAQELAETRAKAEGMLRAMRGGA